MWSFFVCILLNCYLEQRFALQARIYIFLIYPCNESYNYARLYTDPYLIILEIHHFYSQFCQTRINLEKFHIFQHFSPQNSNILSFLYMNSNVIIHLLTSLHKYANLISLFSFLWTFTILLTRQNLLCQSATFHAWNGLFVLVYRAHLPDTVDFIMSM